MIKKLLLICFVLFLVPSVLAYDYTTDENSLDRNGNKVTSTYVSDVDKTFYHMSYEEYYKQTRGTKTDYTNYLEDEVNKLVVEDAITTTRENYTPEVNSTLVYDGSYENSRWFTPIIEWIKELFARQDIVESELCEKDNTYSWCVGVTPK